MFFRCFFCTVRLSIFERFVFPKGSKFNRLVWDSLEIWKCGLYIHLLIVGDKMLQTCTDTPTLYSIHHSGSH